MNLTDYHANHFAHEPTKRRSSDSMEKLAGAQVDLNPHEVDAALFAFNSPLFKGALLADEVGLGRELKESRRAAAIALTLEEELAGHKAIKALEVKRDEKRWALFDAQDQVDKQREGLIANIEGKLIQRVNLKPLFTLRWHTLR